MFIFNILYVIFNNRFKQLKKSKEALQPYNNGPIINISDIIISIISQQYKNGLLEIYPKLILGFIINPIVKYCMIANPYLYDLTENYINQTTNEISSSKKNIINGLTKLLSYSLLDKKRNNIIDKHIFVPYYPIPTNNRNWANGIQVASTFALIVHSSHIYLNSSNYNHKMLSKHGDEPIYMVVLWYNNPFHIYTGYVEVNYNKNNTFEHPMWLIGGKNKLGIRNIWNVDEYFHSYSHELTNFISNQIINNSL